MATKGFVQTLVHSQTTSILVGEAPTKAMKRFYPPALQPDANEL